MLPDLVCMDNGISLPAQLKRTTCGVSLEDLMGRLYDYDLRLRAAFEQIVRREAIAIMAGTGDPVKKVHQSYPGPANPEKRKAFERRRKKAIREAKFNVWPNRRLSVDPTISLTSDGRFGPAEEAAKKLARGRLRKLNKPCEYSLAWEYALRWVAMKEPDFPSLTTNLTELCAILRTEQYAHAQPEGERRRFAKGIANELWKRRYSKCPQLRKLSQVLDGLNGQGGGDVLLREIWERYSDEAADIPLIIPDERRFSAKAEANQGVSSMFAGERHFLDGIVACVHEDGHHENKTERYHAMIRQWAEEVVRDPRLRFKPLREYTREQLPDWTDEQIEAHVRMHDFVDEGGAKHRGEDAQVVLHDPISITTHAGTPLNKAYATLAAIHDASDHCAFPIDPWTSKNWPRVGESSREDLYELNLSIKFEILKGCVRNLTEADEPGLRQMLDEVSADLKRYLGGNLGVGNGRTGQPADSRRANRPIWERLVLWRSEDGSDHTAILGRQRITIRGDAAFKMLTVLQTRKGKRVKGILLHKEIRRPPNQVFRLLDNRLQRIIDTPGQGGTGYAMREHAPRPQGTRKNRGTSRKSTVAVQKTRPKRTHRR